MSHSPSHILDQLSATIHQRRLAGDAQTSYVARLLSKGREKIAQKVGEEAVETVIAALSSTTGTPQKLAEESADLLFHLLVLWEEAGLSPDDVWSVLRQREGVGGLDEKANRPQE